MAAMELREQLIGRVFIYCLLLLINLSFRDKTDNRLFVIVRTEL